MRYISSTFSEGFSMLLYNLLLADMGSYKQARFNMFIVTVLFVSFLKRFIRKVSILPVR